MPSAVPRRSRNHPATIFRPGGYTHASATPVHTRRRMTATALSANGMAALAAAPMAHPAANSRRALRTSARLSSALVNVPATNPAWTAIVSHAVPARDSASASAIAGAAAVAENHSVMPRNWPVATSSSMRTACAEGAGRSFEGVGRFSEGAGRSSEGVGRSFRGAISEDTEGMGSSDTRSRIH